MDGGKKSVISKWLQMMVVGSRPNRTLARVGLIVFAGVILFVAGKYLVTPIRVDGISMAPTYNDGGYNFINRLAYRHAKPQRGDVVGVYFVARQHKLCIKRVVGLPGESVSFRHGVLYVDDKPVNEPYLTFRCTWDMAPVHLGPNFYYVVGDNRSMNIEDHWQGKADLVTGIIGRVLLHGNN